MLARSFPTNLTAKVFGYDVKPSFTVQNEAQISAPPTVSFEKPRRYATGMPLTAPLASAAVRRLAASPAGRRACAAGASRAVARCCCCAAAARAQDVLPVPPLSGRVIDQTGTLTPRRRRRSTPSWPRSRAAAARRSWC